MSLFSSMDCLIYEGIKKRGKIMKLVSLILCGGLLLNNIICPIAEAEELVSEICYADSNYRGSSFQGNVEERIYYHHKTETDYHIQYSVPHYVDLSDGVNTNCCASTAGGIIMGYYDRLYDELIPNFTAGRTIRGVYIYSAGTAVVQEQAMDPLYIAMKTNTTGEGTTSLDCRNGLKSVVEQRGRNCTYISTVSNNAILFNNYEASINREHPVLLFTQGYNLVAQGEFEEAAGQDLLLKYNYIGAHVFVAYGYKRVDYYNEYGGLVDSRAFLYVSSGNPDMKKCYFLLDSTANIIEGYEVVIS